MLCACWGQFYPGFCFIAHWIFTRDILVWKGTCQQSWAPIIGPATRETIHTASCSRLIYFMLEAKHHCLSPKHHRTVGHILESTWRSRASSFDFRKFGIGGFCSWPGIGGPGCGPGCHSAAAQLRFVTSTVMHFVGCWSAAFVTAGRNFATYILLPYQTICVSISCLEACPAENSAAITR